MKDKLSEESFQKRERAPAKDIVIDRKNLLTLSGMAKQEDGEEAAVKLDEDDYGDDDDDVDGVGGDGNGYEKTLQSFLLVGAVSLLLLNTPEQYTTPLSCNRTRTRAKTTEMPAATFWDALPLLHMENAGCAAAAPSAREELQGKDFFRFHKRTHKYDLWCW